VDVWLAPTLARGDGWIATMRHLARENRMYVVGRRDHHGGRVLMTQPMPREEPKGRVPMHPEGLVLRLARRFSATPEQVYSALSHSHVLAQWWGPAGFVVPWLTFEPRVGHAYRIQMQPPDGDPFFLSGEFREVRPPTRLSFTFAWEDPDPDDVVTTVVIECLPAGSATELVMRQQWFATEARRALHQAGWSDSFDRLASLIEGTG
jgi:uncharacterized protein YndB with AHSA1/START domain